LRAARDGGARHVRVLPTGFPMAANIRAWLPGAVAHFAATEGGTLRIELAEPPEPEDAAEALVALTAHARPQDARDATPSLGKPGWQFLPDFDTHVLVCTGPRCAFRGAGTLQARLKTMLAEAGLSDRCLTTTTGCLYPCNQGPLVALYPAGAWYHVPDETALHRLVTDVIAGGGDAPDLRLAERPGSRRVPLSSNPTRRNG
jgi:(2Fe-2S) ferredoxin